MSEKMPASWVPLKSLALFRRPLHSFSKCDTEDGTCKQNATSVTAGKAWKKSKENDEMWAWSTQNVKPDYNDGKKVAIQLKEAMPRTSSKGSEDMTQVLDSQVCQITESPYRILKMAAQGKLKEVEKLYFANRKRLLIADTKGWTALHHATANNRADVIAFLADHNADLNEVNKEEDTPLHLAVKFEAVDATKQLIKRGADTSKKDKNLKTPLHLSVYHNRISILKVFMEHNDVMNFNARDENGRTALHIAAQYDHDEAARMLIANYSVCPKQSCNNGFYPIHLAAKNASVRVLEEILKWAEKQGCQRKQMIAVPDSEGNAPLHLAVHGGEIKAVELCLLNGANITWLQQDGSTPVHLACSQGALDIVKLMFEMQPAEKIKVLGMQDAQGMTPLHCAAMFDHSELVFYLLKEGAFVDAVDKEHRSSLLLAASQKCWKSVEVLLNNGADPGVRDISLKNILHIIIMNGGSITDVLSFQHCSMMSRFVRLMNEQDVIGCSPMHYASKSGQIRSVNSLIQLGASVRIKNQKNESPLHFAARYGRYNTVRQLLDSPNGFLIMNECDGLGKTALHIASEEGHTRVVQLLMSKGALLHRDFQGRTPLHLAAQEDYVETIYALMAVWGHLLDQQDKDGNTPLHLAVKNNKPNTITHLLNLKCKFIENNIGCKAIDYAIQYKLHEAAIAIITHERGMVEVIQSPSVVHGCVCIALIRTLPKVFEAALNEAITKANVKENSKNYYIKYSFYPLQLTEEQISLLSSLKKDPKWRPPSLVSCNAMVENGRVELLMHPLTQKFLEMKWHAYGMYIHLLNMFFYLLFLGMVTIFASGVLGKPHEEITYIREAHIVYNNATNATTDRFTIKLKYSTCCMVLAIGILLSSTVGILKELFQIYQQKLKYISDAINIVEWILYTTSICMVLPVMHGSSYALFSEQQFNSAAIAVLTAWFTLLLYFQRFDHIGIYIVMFLEILNTLLKVLAVFSVLIVAFALALHILLSPGEHLAFSNIPLAMVRTFCMMLGEIDFMNSFVYPYFEKPEGHEMTLLFPKTTFIILLVFMIFMPILLVNLLIGLAVGDIESVKKNAQLKRIAMQVDLHTGLENKLPTCLIKKVNRHEIVVYPNDTLNQNKYIHRIFEALNFATFNKDYSKAEYDLHDGLVNDLLLEEAENQQRSLNEMQGQLEQQTKLLRLIMQKMEIYSEADETDEGVSFEESLHPGSRSVRRWTHSAGLVNSRRLSLHKTD